MGFLSRLAKAFRTRQAQADPVAKTKDLYATARVAVRDRNPEVALPLIDEILELEPDHAQALEGKLLMVHSQGELQSADSLAEQWLIDPTPNRLRAVARYRLACREPLAALEALDQVDDNDARLDAWKARALFQLGRYTEAGAAAESALELDPDLAQAHQLLGEISSERRSTERALVPLAPRVEVFSPLRHRVLHMVTSSLPHTVAGYTIRSQAIARAQIELGLEPHFVTKPGFPEHKQVPDLEVVEGVPYHRLSPGVGPTPEDRRIELYAELAREVVETVRPSVLHPATGFPNAVAALSLREVFDIPVVYEVRGFLEDSWVAANSWASEDADRYRWRRAAEIECMKSADAVVTLAKVMKDEIMGWGVATDKIWVVPNGVDVDRFRPAPKNENLARSLGIGPDEVVVGYISSLTAHEGIGYLIEGIAILIERGRHVRGLLVGDGPERHRLEQLAVDLGIGDHVLFTGAVPQQDVVAYYNLIDVFVVPRTSDRVAQLVTPLKPFEAMAMGIPLVVSDVPALQEIVIDGETGLTFRPENAQDLADRIEWIIGDPRLGTSLGSHAREWVGKHRSWAGTAARYTTIYGKVLGEPTISSGIGR